jgi:hypothetical protein
VLSTRAVFFTLRSACHTSHSTRECRVGGTWISGSRWPQTD